MNNVASLHEEIVLVGHPFVPIGMGELLRSTARSLQAVREKIRVLDVYGSTKPDPSLGAEFGSLLTDRVGNGLNIFCINGDEIDPVLEHLGVRAEGGKRIIYPAWELSKYPDEWARKVETFDGIWALSKFTRDSIAKSVSKPVAHVPLAIHPQVPPRLGRQAFGIPEDSYTFMFLFDYTSYIERKNPLAVIEAFKVLLAERPMANVRLIMKTNHSDANPDARTRLVHELEKLRDRVVLLDYTMKDAELKALYSCCDAFVSLHRSEGFGLALAEAMFFGKPVISTNFGGNTDFMTDETAFLVGYELIPVAEDAYPHAAGQVWAEADVRQAADHMVRLVDDPAIGLAKGKAASRHVRIYFSRNATGLRYQKQMEDTVLF
jgi:glycosyltransferase involved in cell wall biosynthesis